MPPMKGRDWQMMRGILGKKIFIFSRFVSSTVGLAAPSEKSCLGVPQQSAQHHQLNTCTRGGLGTQSERRTKRREEFQEVWGMDGKEMKVSKRETMEKCARNLFGKDNKLGGH